MTSLCEIILVGDENGLQRLHMNTGEGKRKFELDPAWTRDDILFENVSKQLLEYFSGKRKTFNVKLNPKGTDYQRLIWDLLQEIPYGQVRTYKDLAVLSGKPSASRAVGSANGKNPIPIIIPCHRVIGSNGKLTGFAHGLKAKEKLIQLEGNNL
tara:strand:- start:559 stop:1020 length:462 start_codon:yes stop_codon:yes gene_type:complete